MKNLTVLCSSLLLVALAAASAEAQAFRLTNPFNRGQDESRQPAPRRSVNDAPAAAPSRPGLPPLPKPTLPKFELPKFALPKFEMPKLTMPQLDMPRMRRPSRNPSEPTTWEKFNHGTQNFFSKTKATLMPWTAEASPPPRSNRPPNRTARTTSNRDRNDGGSSFFPWIKPRPPEKEIRTVNDFLELPSPRY